MTSLGIPSLVARSIEANCQGALARAQAIIDQTKDTGVDIIAKGSKLYPPLLGECCDAPAVLFVRGNHQVLSNPYAISSVGTRHANGTGLKLTNQIITQAAQSGIGVSIVSGLALGIDRASHLAALEANIPTVAVLPGFVDQITPTSHHSLARRIVNQGGALISEMPPMTPLSRGHFVSRNRIIAGLSSVTIMFQSATKGGAMVTADLANGYDREVFTPPSATDQVGFEGNIELLKSSRAHILSSFDDIAQLMNWNAKPKKSATDQRVAILESLTPQELKVYSVIPESEPTSIDHIAYHANESVAKTSAILTMLEIKGLIYTSKGRLYHKL